MLLILNKGCVVQRQANDPRIPNESSLWYAIRNELRRRGKDVIKKLMWKDGHLTSDTQYYVRDRKSQWAIYDDHYQIRLLHQDYNSGKPVYLNLVRLDRKGL